jgi:hypothetical protein
MGQDDFPAVHLSGAEGGEELPDGVVDGKIMAM